MKLQFVGSGFRIVCVLWGGGLVLSAGAAILTDVPMQGSMLMPMVSYHAEKTNVTVMLPMVTPQLIPLLASNPNDSFDPGAPWYDCLDPSRQGLAFSRRDGFDMDTMSDTVPSGLALWIRKLSSSPGLGAYLCRSKASPPVWQPIFGTAGTTNALWWDQTMFHPAFTAPPGTNTYTATFEVFVMDTSTGLEVAGSSSGPLTFNWTAVPDGRPTLSIGPNVTIGWPASATNYLLEAADTLSATSWATVTNVPVVMDGRAIVVLDPAGEARKFFRMRRVP